LAVLMASTYGGEGDRAAAMRAGADGYLVKPVDPDALKAALNDILVRRGWQASSLPTCIEK
jgi:DNA-binding response OmpR family regulator